MTGLAAVIRDSRAAELQRKETAAATLLAAEVDITPPDLDQTTIEYFQIFAKWCSQMGVRSCPAKPTTVAAWIAVGWQAKAPLDFFLKVTDAIARLHDHNGLANPCATTPVRAALEKISDVKPPHGWNKAEKLRFAELPIEIREAIARRELDRERAFSRQNTKLYELTEELQRLKDGAEPKPVELEKEN